MTRRLWVEDGKGPPREFGASAINAIPLVGVSAMVTRNRQWDVSGRGVARGVATRLMCDGKYGGRIRMRRRTKRDRRDRDGAKRAERVEDDCWEQSESETSLETPSPVIPHPMEPASQSQPASPSMPPDERRGSPLLRETRGGLIGERTRRMTC